MSTYSYGTPPTNATNLNDITSVLNQLPDNTSKQISPNDIRDAVYTAWENILFKSTSISTGQGYIGLDSTQNGLTQSKMYFGKRRYLGVDIMTNTLLSSSTDIFFYNNRPDSALQDTKISFLSGTDSSIMSVAPYIESKAISGSHSYMDLNIVNNSTDSNGSVGGNINIGSTRGFTAGGGKVSINGITFPSYLAPNSAEALAVNGYTLIYNSNGNLTWGTVSSSGTYSTPGSNGSSGSSGSSGFSGSSGSSGSSGENGSSGSSGSSGANGVGDATMLGTADYIPKFLGATAIVDSSIIDSTATSSWPGLGGIRFNKGINHNIVTGFADDTLTTYTMDMSQSNFFVLTLMGTAGTRTLDYSNEQPGQYTVIVKQDGVGNKNLALASGKFKGVTWSTSTSIALGSNAESILEIFYDGSKAIIKVEPFLIDL